MEYTVLQLGKRGSPTVLWSVGRTRTAQRAPSPVTSPQTSITRTFGRGSPSEDHRADKLIAAAWRNMMPVMKVVITGSTGLIGSALVPLLEGRGDRVTRLRRGSPPGAGQAWWDPGSGLLSPDAFDGAGAVVHLAGENIASGRWTSARRSRIRDSRVLGTRLLCETLATLDNPPPVLVSSSAIGYYGDRSAQMLDESALPGSGFLAEVCQAWEAAVEPARKCGIRVRCLADRYCVEHGRRCAGSNAHTIRTRCWRDYRFGSAVHELDHAR